jgi:hypothetical protein
LRIVVRFGCGGAHSACDCSCKHCSNSNSRINPPYKHRPTSHPNPHHNTSQHITLPHSTTHPNPPYLTPHRITTHHTQHHHTPPHTTSHHTPPHTHTCSMTVHGCCAQSISSTDDWPYRCLRHPHSTRPRKVGVQIEIVEVIAH